MTLHFNILLVILACAVVTLIPRVMPFLLARKISLPAYAVKWLSFIPVCVLTALVAGSIVTKNKFHLMIHWTELAVIVPTLVIALWSKRLSVTVIAGIALMAAARLLVHFM